MSIPDTNYRSFADETEMSLDGLRVDPRDDGLNPADFDDLLKLSHVRNSTIRNFGVYGGGLQRENAIDINRLCQLLTLERGVIEAGRQNAITIKGGTCDVLLKEIEIIRPGGGCDIELGNFSDQSFERTTGIVIDRVYRKDGRPVRIRVGQADCPKVFNSNVEFLRAESAVLKLYVWAKQRSRLWFGGKLKFLLP